MKKEPTHSALVLVVRTVVRKICCSSSDVLRWGIVIYEKARLPQEE
jgi:hypothetical protein